MFDIIGKKHIFFTLSIVLIICGFIGYLVNGLQLDIQFQGGTVIQIQMNDSNFETAKAEDIVQKTINKRANVFKSQTIDANQTGKKIDLLVLNVASKEDTLSGDELNKVVAALRQEFNVKPNGEVSVNSVAPFLGKSYMISGLKAIFWASLLIVIYIWIRFKAVSGLSAGVTALAALVHDALMILSTYIIFGLPLNENFIASILTILGYSINDTIVIYDRIRENSRYMKKTSFAQVVNKSILQSLTRSINTSVCTFLSMATVYVFAAIYNIQSIRDFAFPLMIGIISGCYSTIFIAGPLWVMWKEYKAKRRISSKPVKA
jgi:preprotein translocase subunit SecF